MGGNYINIFYLCDTAVWRGLLHRTGEKVRESRVQTFLMYFVFLGAWVAFWIWGKQLTTLYIFFSYTAHRTGVAQSDDNLELQIFNGGR